MIDTVDVLNAGSITDLILEELAESEESAVGFLKESFLAEAMVSLFEARRAAGLSQAEVAERMGTRQPAIARIEADTRGAISLRRYVEFAAACGTLPLDMALVPAAQLRQFAMAYPNETRTGTALQAWAMSQSQAENKPQGAAVTLAVPAVPTTTGPLQATTVAPAPGPVALSQVGNNWFPTNGAAAYSVPSPVPTPERQAA